MAGEIRIASEMSEVGNARTRSTGARAPQQIDRTLINSPRVPSRPEAVGSV